jgi:hypothetical protein
MMGQKIENEIVQDYTKLAPILRSFSFIEGRNLIRIKNESVEKRDIISLLAARLLGL